MQSRVTLHSVQYMRMYLGVHYFNFGGGCLRKLYYFTVPTWKGIEIRMWGTVIFFPRQPYGPWFVRDGVFICLPS